MTLTDVSTQKDSDFVFLSPGGSLHLVVSPTMWLWTFLDQKSTSPHHVTTARLRFPKTNFMLFLMTDGHVKSSYTGPKRAMFRIKRLSLFRVTEYIIDITDDQMNMLSASQMIRWTYYWHHRWSECDAGVSPSRIPLSSPILLLPILSLSPILSLASQMIRVWRWCVTLEDSLVIPYIGSVTPTASCRKGFSTIFLLGI